MSNPLYKNVRGKVITDFYSEYDLNMLGHKLSEFYTGSSADDYQKACSLLNAATTLEDKDLEEAALSLVLKMQQEEGCGKE